MHRISICALISVTILSGISVADEGAFDRTAAVMQAMDEYGYIEMFDTTLLEIYPVLHEDVGFCWSRKNQKTKFSNCVNRAFATNEVCGYEISPRELVDCWAEQMDAIEQKTNEYTLKQTSIDNHISWAKHERMLDEHDKRHAEWLAAEEERRTVAQQHSGDGPS